MYTDLLKPPSILSLILQDSNVDIVTGIKHILKSSKNLKSLKKQDPIQWPTGLLLLGSRKTLPMVRMNIEVLL